MGRTNIAFPSAAADLYALAGSGLRPTPKDVYTSGSVTCHLSLLPKCGHNRDLLLRDSKLESLPDMCAVCSAAGVSYFFARGEGRLPQARLLMDNPQSKSCKEGGLSL